MDEKQHLRARMRGIRRDHVESLGQSTRALLFLRPPAAVMALVPEQATVALYHALPHEAPTAGYGRWFMEAGHRVALPWFADRGAPMCFRAWRDPHSGTGLVKGPHGPQPEPDAEKLMPYAVFIPLVAFTPDGQRLGQGGGHYDRWLARHPAAVPIGLAWDCQMVESLPAEAHDQRLRAVITPTRIWQGND